MCDLRREPATAGTVGRWNPPFPGWHRQPSPAEAS